MSELRRDPIIGQWVNVLVKKSWSPEQYEKEDQALRHEQTCQFCPGRERHTPPEIDAIRDGHSASNTPGWLSRVIPNKFPALKIEGDINERQEGLFGRCDGVGAHEVVIETPDHKKNMAEYSREEMGRVIELYQRRHRDLTEDRRFKYIVIFKNFGESAGTSVEHAHSQIIALPMIPKYVLSELEGVQRYHSRHQKCVFCDMIEQEYRDAKRIISENEAFIAFCPFVPRYAFEFWILPKAHQSNFAHMDPKTRDALGSILKDTLARLKACLSDPSFNYYLHCAPVNTGGVQDIHWHIEVVPKLTKTTGFEWGTGFYVVRTSPEAAAGYLRNVPVSAGV